MDSDTPLRAVRPDQLHRVSAELLVLPGTDVADLAIGVVIPPLTGHRVGDRLGELVGADRRQRVERLQVAEAPRAIGIRNDRVIQPTRGPVVITAECLAGALAPGLHRAVGGRGVGGALSSRATGASRASRTFPAAARCGPGPSPPPLPGWEQLCAAAALFPRFSPDGGGPRTLT